MNEPTTTLECLWLGKRVRIHTLWSKNGGYWYDFGRYYGHVGTVLRETKSRMLLVQWDRIPNPVGVPPSLLEKITEK